MPTQRKPKRKRKTSSPVIEALSPEIWGKLPRDILMVIAKFISGRNLVKWLGLNQSLRKDIARLYSDNIVKQRVREVGLKFRFDHYLRYKGTEIGHVSATHTLLNWRNAKVVYRRELATYALLYDTRDIFDTRSSVESLTLAFAKHLWLNCPHLLTCPTFDYLVKYLLAYVPFVETQDHQERLTSILLRICCVNYHGGWANRLDFFWPPHRSNLEKLASQILPQRGDKIVVIDAQPQAIYLKIQGIYYQTRPSREWTVPDEFLQLLRNQNLVLNPIIGCTFSHFKNLLGPVVSLKPVKIPKS